jgi:hypothetical protein
MSGGREKVKKIGGEGGVPLREMRFGALDWQRLDGLDWNRGVRRPIAGRSIREKGGSCVLIG